MTTEQLQTDLTVIQNYYNYLNSKLDLLKNASTNAELNPEVASLLQQASDGIHHELKFVSYRLESISKQLAPEVLADDAELGVTRTVNGVQQ